ncbi:hypothetical protein SKAU_G00033460 [Synaphobranchus kaupii]|uniref:Uncharacterized protein n=1 Tax=Synaphobranchus kaupii TaxID=118154 RepID=A0A9Q1GF98_SYNKA|nr:hypothetical protein SKAU_G00033460 [Synaphobranchus kaupii]
MHGAGRARVFETRRDLRVLVGQPHGSGPDWAEPALGIKAKKMQLRTSPSPDARQPYDSEDPKESSWGIVHDPSGGRSEVSPTGPEGGAPHGSGPDWAEPALGIKAKKMQLRTSPSPDARLRKMFVRGDPAAKRPGSSE